MNIIQRIAAVTCVAMAMQGCTKDFDKLNTDPNNVSQISPGTLLNPIIYEVSSFNMLRADDVTFNFMQVALPFPSTSGGLHRYDIAEYAGTSTWNTYYRWLKNAKEMYDVSVRQEDPNYQAIALTLRAWIGSNLTDCFGDIPFDEALRGDEGIFTPKFNTQQEIYTSLIAGLDSANNLFNTSRTMVFGTEMLFANNVTRWKKFCNSLRMRLLLRVSKRTEMNAWAQLRAMLDNPTKYPVFASNAEAAILSLSGISPYVSPWGRAIDFTTFRAAGKFFSDSLNAFNDPRRAKFMTQARNSAGTTNIGYQGIPSGYSGGENQFAYIPSNVNVALVTAPMINVIMPYSEVEFIKAELEFNSGNAAAAKTAYEKAVKAAIEQWSLTVPTDYFTAPATAYNNTLSRIMIQKYYAMYFVDYQQWFDYRRTGLPVMPVNTGMVNNKQMPVRYRFPLSVKTNNPENYQKAKAAMGGDDNNTKVWWEK